MDRPDPAVSQVLSSWSDEDLKLLELIVRLMELDPTFERLERAFFNAFLLMNRLRKNEPEGENWRYCQMLWMKNSSSGALLDAIHEFDSSNHVV
jgi:hypothetical protein